MAPFQPDDAERHRPPRADVDRTGRVGHAITSPFAGNLTVEITTGPACAPSCAHGTGMNLQKLFVR